MPSPEYPPPDHEPAHELLAYHQTARFPNERPAGKAYAKAQDLIHRRLDVDISAYRLIVQKRCHVSVLGDAPPADVDKRVRQILSTGEAATLPEDMLRLLNHRHLAKQMQPWAEAHHIPGKIIDLGEPGKQQQ
jgi:hypothetical protein